MRTLLAGELEQAQDRESDYHVKLEVQNASGTWIDVGALLGTHWIVNATWGEDRDTPVAPATFTLVRNIGVASLAPLMSASALNVDDAMAYAPLLHIGRLMRAFTATMPWGMALDTGKYRPAFTGRIDDVFVQDDPEGRASVITLPCSDLGGWLMDLQIETSGVEYGDPVTPPTLETALQAVIDDNIPVGEPAVTLFKESSSSFGVTGYAQGETKLMEGLVTLVLDSTGEDLRYRFDASHVSQLTWFNPDRSRVTVDAAFTKNQYNMSRLDLSLGNIRNAGEMSYTDSVTLVTGTVTSEDAASISNYRRRFFRLPASPMLATAAESQTVIDNVVNDLSGPPGEAQVQLAFCWFVQLYDRYTFEANGRQYDQDQTFAVGGYQHTIENGRGSTVLTPCTARIVGAYAAWQKRVVVPNVLGPTGASGPAGPSGPLGPSGVTGVTGPIGVTGASGAQGPTGVQGVQGIQGVVGVTGAAGATGPTGAAGPTGSPGPTGSQGPSGAIGVTWRGPWSGATAYVIADLVQSGGSSYICILGHTNQIPPNGTYWELVSQQGLLGVTGPTGATGTTGVTGASGAQGPTGVQGVQGIQGVVGVTGAAGATGPTGAVGPTGGVGPTGAVGPTGPNTPVIQCHCTQKLSATTRANGVVAGITFDTNDKDDSGLHTTFTAPIYIDSTGGVAILTGKVQWDANTAGTRKLTIYKNSVAQVPEILWNTPISGATMHIVWFDYDPNSGDFYELVPYQDSGGTRTLDPVYFSMIHLKG